MKSLASCAAHTLGPFCPVPFVGVVYRGMGREGNAQVKMVLLRHLGLLFGQHIMEPSQRNVGIAGWDVAGLDLVTGVRIQGKGK
jgi:hypothetical protein